jgi:fatty acid desaturase
MAPSAEILRELHRPKPLRLTLLLLIDWALIVLCAVVWARTHAVLLLPILWIVIGSRQHGLAVIMHETVHKRLATSWDASAALGRLAVWPLLISWSSFRDNHLAHHKHLNEAGDPDLQFKLNTAPNDWRFPKRPWTLIVLLMKDLVGNGIISNFRRLARYRRAASGDKVKIRNGRDPLIPRILVIAAFIASWVGLAGWQSFAILWLIPIFTTLPFMLRVRSISEHFHLPIVSAESTRTVTASWFEREVLGFGPHMIGYHGAHHRYPGVPCHDLKRLHRVLLNDPVYTAECCTTNCYVIGRRSLVKELVSAAPSISPAQAGTRSTSVHLTPSGIGN